MNRIFVSSNNFSAYKLIEEWPIWPKMFKYFGSSGSGKTHLAKILKKIDKTKLIEAKDINDKIIKDLINFDCLSIDSFKNNIDERLLYSILNQEQLENYILINSVHSIKILYLN